MEAHNRHLLSHVNAEITRWTMIRDLLQSPDPPHGKWSMRSNFQFLLQFVQRKTKKTRTGSEEALYCSFCRKSRDAVARLISSPRDYPRAYICDECVAVCSAILEDDSRESGHPATAASSPDCSETIQREEVGNESGHTCKNQPHEAPGLEEDRGREQGVVTARPAS